MTRRLGIRTDFNIKRYLMDHPSILEARGGGGATQMSPRKKVGGSKDKKGS